MSLRTRFALTFAAISAVAAALVGVLGYWIASDRLTGEADRSLSTVTVALADYSGNGQVASGGQGSCDADERCSDMHVVVQRVTPDGTVVPLVGAPLTLPVSNATLALAASGTARRHDTVEVEVAGHTYRQRTTVLSGGRGVLQVAAPVDHTRLVLGGMANQFAAVAGLVLLTAAAAGRLVARRITRRLVRLTGIAERVSASGRVDDDVPVDGADEVGRLAASFNTMLSRIEAARDTQERLVQDVAHELRTPLTSLRTNATVLRRITELSPDSRGRLIDDIEGESRELSHLVDELIELARFPQENGADEPVPLAEVATGAAERVYRRTGRRVLIASDDRVVLGDAEGLARAIGNLLDNAAKFDPDGDEPLSLRIEEGVVTVSDRGPGISESDAARVFDRFYRADTARALPGAGLGLAIVRDVALAHGGSVFARERPGGGAEIGFTVDRSRTSPGRP